MTYDYWNHPIIVKAIRTRHRGGKLFFVAMTYLTILFLGGVLMFHYQHLLGTSYWVSRYFAVLMTIQFLISGLMATSTVSSSMQAEVTTRTLDFQRIATLPPRQILLGKALGEPTTSYLLAASTIPIGVFCATLGGIGFRELILVYLNLATTTFMLACLGLQNSLEPAAPGKSSAGAWGCVGPLLGMMWVSMFLINIRGGGAFSALLSGLVGLVTPVLAISGLYQENVWFHTFSTFDYPIPIILITPISQFLIAMTALHCMTRRLTLPLDTYVGKMQGYLVIGVFDLVMAAFNFGTISFGEGLVAPAARFAIGHTVVSLVVTVMATPRRESYLSWVWRKRGKKNLIIDWIAGERTLNTLFVPVTLLIAIAIFSIGIIAPMAVYDSTQLSATNWNSLMHVIVLLVVTNVTVGYCFQTMAILAPRESVGLLVGGGLILTAGPAIAGSLLGLEWLSALSPVTTINRLLTDSDRPMPVLPLSVVFLSTTGFLCWGLKGVTRNMRRRIDRTMDSLNKTDRIEPRTQAS